MTHTSVTRRIDLFEIRRLKKQNADLVKQNADLVAALKKAEIRLEVYKEIRAGEFWDTNDEFALNQIRQALAQVGETNKG